MKHIFVHRISACLVSALSAELKRYAEALCRRVAGVDLEPLENTQVWLRLVDLNSGKTSSSLNYT